MNEFKKYRRTNIAEMRPYQEGETLDSRVSISQADKNNGSPKVGDMIARNPQNHEDQWLVAKAYYEANFEEASEIVIEIPIERYLQLVENEKLAYEIINRNN